MDIYDVAVVGAGITGCATALELARGGASVVLIDRFGPAAMASGWTLAGVRQSGRDPAELPLAMAAIRVWRDLHQDLDAPTGYTRGGNLRLARNAREYAQIQQMVAAQAALGLDLEFLPDNAGIRQIAPAVSRAIPGASYCATDGHADPQAVRAAYIGALQRAGVVLHMGEAVETLDIVAGRIGGIGTSARRIAADRVVLATGVAGNGLLAPVEAAVPFETPMVAVIRSAPMAPVLEQVIGVAGGDWAGRQELSGRLRLTSGALAWNGAMTVAATDLGPRPRISPPMASLAEIVAKLDQLLPGLSSAPIEECWAGVLDLTPDALPVMDHVPGVEGLVVGAGFSGHGFGIGPVTGRILCALATGATPDWDISAFGYDRFSGVRAKAPLALHG